MMWPLPSGYLELLGDLKQRVQEAQNRAHRTVNTQVIELCIGLLDVPSLPNRANRDGVAESSIGFRGIYDSNSHT